MHGFIRELEIHILFYACLTESVYIFKQEWSGAILSKDRYETYRSFKYIFGDETYITDIDIFCFRVALTQFRLGVLPINNNAHRYSDNPGATYCPNCKDVIENEHHFLLQCPLYTDLRLKFIQCLSHLPILSVSTVLKWRDADRCKPVSKFIFHAFNRRRQTFDS